MVDPRTDKANGEVPFIPDIRGLSLVDAGLALAARGNYLLLVTTGKHPGSHVGRGWPAKSTCNPNTITQWCAANAHGGLAIHTGRSGLIAFDYDREDLADELVWLKVGLHQSSRGGRNARGHYVFASTQTFTSGKLKLTDGTVVGEIRSGNTVILTEPSPHPKADEGGEYRWVTTGVVPPLPDEATAYLTTKAGGGAAERLPLNSSADGEAYWAAHGDEPQPWRRKALRDKYAEHLTTGGEHHNAMMKVLGWAAREVEAGFIAAEVFDDLYDDWIASFGADDRSPDGGEFQGMLRRAVADAQASDTKDLRNRGNRDFGTDHRDYVGLLNGIEFIPDAGQADQSADSNGNTVDSDDADQDKFDADVAEVARRMRVRDAARNVIARAQWDEPDDQGDLAHQIDHPQPELGYLVADLIPARGFVLINAQYKVGKSTLASVNLTYALATGQPFLRHYKTNLGENENVAIWNLEVDQGTLTGWLQRTGMDRNAQKRIHPMCLRGNRSVDFDNELAVEWTVRWLAARQVAVWVIDPLSKLYRDDEQDNSAFNRWWLRVEDIAARAGVRVVVLVHHTGHDETTADRARGASAMMGNPDVLVTYRHAGRHGGHPPDSKRYLSAIGRNVDVREFELDFDAGTGQLHATGSGTNRVEARRRKSAVSVWEHLQTTAAALPKTALLDAVGLASKGKGAGESTDVLDYAEAQGWVVMVPNGNRKLYSCGAATPPMAERSAAWMASAGNGPIITQSAKASKNAP